MFLQEGKKIPIIKGSNDCFFEEGSFCYHVEAEKEKCRGYVCHLHKPLRPLKRE